MDLLDKILDCERQYTSLTSLMKEEKTHISFKDEISPDQPMQNYIFIKRNTSSSVIKKLIRQEKRRLYREKLEYIRFVFDPLLANSGELPEFADFTFDRFFVFTLNLKQTKTLCADKDCFIVDNIHKSSFEDLYYSLNRRYKHDDPHLNRWIDLKLQDPQIETVVYKDRVKFLGSCELYLHNKIAKIEDLEVLKPFRGRGIGFSLLKAAVSIAQYKGIEILYLISKNEDKITTYYINKGFTCYTIYNSCTLYS